MKYMVVTLLAGVALSACNSPQGPSTVSMAGDWGGGSRTQGTYRQTTCAVTGFFATPPPGLGWCDGPIGSEGRVGLSLAQMRDAISGTVFFIDGGRAVAGTVNGTSLSVSGSWSQYPGDPNPAAAAYLRTITWNGSVAGDAMSGDFTIRDSFREGSGFTGTLTVGYHLISMTRD